MKRLAIKLELLLFGRCYCAAPEIEVGGTLDDLDDAGHLSLAVPFKSWAMGKAKRRTEKSGTPWIVTKWERR